jgi:hypothetical protein
MKITDLILDLQVMQIMNTGDQFDNCNEMSIKPELLKHIVLEAKNTDDFISLVIAINTLSLDFK